MICVHLFLKIIMQVVVILNLVIHVIHTLINYIPFIYSSIIRLEGIKDV